MQPNQHAVESPVARRYEYDDRTVIAADFGPAAEASVDVVEDTVIVVAGDEQREFDVAGDEVQTFTRNGVVTIEVRG